MEILVLGAGVIGVTSAWYLQRAGHEVTVVERNAEPALETSYANGGQISVSHAEPWANPRAPAKILEWLGKPDAPLVFRPQLDAAQWLWGARFLYECLPHRARNNAHHILALALYSAAALRALRAETAISYDALARGILTFYTDRREFERAAAVAQWLRTEGCVREVKSVAECLAIEPALRHAREKLVGGIYAPGDESGDAHAFTRSLARLCERAGVRFRYGETVEQIETEADRVTTVRLAKPGTDGRQRLSADAYVVALGPFGVPLLRAVGIAVPIYPLKGYSVTLPVTDPDEAPTVSLTDEERKLVFSRLGQRLRVAGMAELAGYDASIDEARCRSVLERALELFPEGLDRGRAQFWAGLRPATPGNVPLIGATRYRNLYLNTGHGTLGWTLACGSGRALAELMDGRRPDVDFPFLRPRVIGSGGRG